MNIGLDMMGGDLAPLEAVKGLQLYLNETSSPATVFLFGDETQINALLQEHNISPANIQSNSCAASHRYARAPHKGAAGKNNNHPLR